MNSSAAPLRTVVVDDSPDLRSLFTIALQRTGRFDVVADAADGESAIEVVGREQPDLLLLDLGMPGMGGFDALPHLRTASPDTVVVVISGYPREGLEERVAARGAAGYVEKRMSVKAMVDDVIATAGVLEVVTSTVEALEARTELDQDLRSGSHARRFVTEALNRWECAGALDTVQLLVSELVTNAVVHAQSRPNVAVLLLSDRIRVEVADEQRDGLARREATEKDESGRGLFLLDELSSAWGVNTSDAGKTVWFEVPRFDTD